MKKLILLSASVIFLAACQPKESTQDTAQAENSTSDMAQVSQALQSGQGVFCEMSKNDGKDQITYRAKDKKVHNSITTSLTGDKVQEMITDGEFVYTWAAGDTTGVKVKMPSAEEMQGMMEQFGQQVPDFNNPNNQQEFENMGYTVNCKVQEVADTEFVPPTTVTFTDASATMQKATDAMKKMTPEQAEAMKSQAQDAMKKFGVSN